MTCKTCDHNASVHLDETGICTYAGCMCNLYRNPTPAPQVPLSGRPALDPAQPPTLDPVAPQATAQTVQAHPGCAHTYRGPPGMPCPLCPRDASGPPDVMDLFTIGHVPFEFVRMMDKVFAEGVKGNRNPGDWKDLSPEAARDKLRSMLRHAGKGQYAAAACNALILWWHFERTES